MPFTSLRFAPGMSRNMTRYATSGGWWDCSMVRFRDGLPEKWAGWQQRYPGFVFDGMTRSLHRHGTLDGSRWISAGTSRKFYMVTDGLNYDVTPMTQAFVMAADPFATTAGSNLVTIRDLNHGHYPGDYVLISGSTGIANIPAAEINGEHVIATWVDSDHYTFAVPTVADATVAAGGGASVTVDYLFSAGSDDVVLGGGWGSGAWSEGVWGGDAWDGGSLTGGGDQLGIWSQDNWGEDLVACAQSGPIFYWDATFPEDRMINILDLPAVPPDLPEADGFAPEEAQFIVVSHRDRHLLAFGCTIYAPIPTDRVVEPMTFRWCSQENIRNWDEADLTGTAGSLPLSNGSKFIAAHATSREIMVWTDQALYSIQYIGSPYIYTAELQDRWSDICGMKAVCSYNGIVYWMGFGGFYAYSGRTEKIPCPIWDYISLRFNRTQAAKVYASSNQNHNEVIFFYPSNDSGNLEIDSYAAYDVSQQIWTFGSLSRTAWLDLDALDFVIAASPDKRIYQHDVGSDDGSTDPPTPIFAFIESGPIELSSEGSYDKGDRMMFVRRILPDVSFRRVTTSTDVPFVNFVLTMMDKPGGGFMNEEISDSRFIRTATIPIEQYTDEAYVRLRGRSLTFRVESNSLGANWRLGVPRIDARTDGQR